jgi:hypothetical protein
MALGPGCGALLLDIPPPLAFFFGARSCTFTPVSFLSFELSLFSEAYYSFVFFGWLLGVGCAEESTTATDVLFWNQVIQAD